MTEGGNQGLFVIIAVVIFGIFVLISYLLFGDKMKTGLATIYCDAFTITSKNTGFKTTQGCELDLGLDDTVRKEYFKIRDKDDAKGWSEVWVLAEFNSDKSQARIIDSGDKDKFTEGDLGTSLIGDISFPDTLSNGTRIVELGKHAFEQAKFANVMKLPNDLVILDDYTLKQSNFSGEATFPMTLEIIGIEALRDSTFSGKIPDLPNLVELREGALANSEFTGNLTSSSLPNIALIGNNALAKSKFTGSFPNVGASSQGIENSSETSGSKRPISELVNTHGIDGVSGVIISDNAFKDSVFTGAYKVPNNVSVIGDNAFQNSKFNSIDLSGNSELTIIGDNAFENSTPTGEIKLSNNIKYIGNKAFYMSKFNNVDFNSPEKLEYIGHYAFYNSLFKNKMFMNEKLKEIGDYAFYNSFGNKQSETTPKDRSLENVYGSASSEDSSFQGQEYSGSQIILNKGIEKIGNFSFYKAQFNNDFDMRLSPNLKYIGDSAFRLSFSSGWYASYKYTNSSPVTQLIGFKKIYFNDTLEYIGNYTFYNARFVSTNDNLSPRNTLPNSLSEIGSDNFDWGLFIPITVKDRNVKGGYSSDALMPKSNIYLSEKTKLNKNSLGRSTANPSKLIYK